MSTTLFEPIVDRIESAVRAGQLTEEQASALMREVVAEATRSTAGSRPQSPDARGQRDPRRGVVTLTENELAVRALIREGASEVEARRAVMASPPGQLAGVIARQRQLEQERADRVAATEYDASPAGRAEAARLALAAEAEQKAKAEEARALLRAEGAPAVELTDAEAVRYAGMDTEEAQRRLAEQRLSTDFDANAKAAGWLSDDGTIKEGGQS